jgi:sterol desaturase/sphingolipid hydroxylase (fatty acid hydroxylase superfamily)
VIYGLVDYYRKHKRAHLDPAWAREHLPWHYDHHMAPDQDANWCVTHPFFDHVMGTRKPYLGTERERQDQERATRRKARAAAQEKEREAA